MEGIDIADLESYSGFITTNASTESNMFFWFFPATVSNGCFCCMYSICWMLGTASGRHKEMGDGSKK